MELIDKRKIANSNAPYFRYPFDTFLEIQRELGIEAIEFWGSTPHLWIDHIDYENCNLIKNKLLEYNLKLVSFTPNPYNYSLSAKFGSIRRENSLAYYINCIKVASELGSPYICVGPYGGEFDCSYEDLLMYYKDSLIKLSCIAEKYEVKILIGTVTKLESKIITTLEELKSLFDEINRDNLKILLNTHSISMVGENIEQWFKVFGDNIVHTHFIDGRYSGSRIWGEGCYPLERYLKLLVNNDYKGYLGQLITSDRYHEDPIKADKKNISALNEYVMGGQVNGFH